jgi:AcrR family transcriptional regulator
MSRKQQNSFKESKRAPGRPRRPAIEASILAVTLRLLGEMGYSRMSIDQIALEAGISKPAIYRRWTGKADLATAAIRSLQLSEPPVDTGSARGDLIGVLENFRKSLLRPNGMSLVGTVLAEENHTPDLLALFRERLVKPRRASLRAVLERARKEIRRGVDIDAAVNALVGAVYAHYLADPRISPDFILQVVNIVWEGVRRPILKK